MRNDFRFAPAIVLLFALLGGCAATPDASREGDADAKRFAPAMNAAIIYIYRPAGYGGQSVATMSIDGRLLGDSLPRTYFRVPLRAGRHRITVAGGDAGRIEIDTRADEVYFVEAQVFGEAHSDSRTQFRSVAPDIGKAAILGCCTMLEAWRPGQSRFNF